MCSISGIAGGTGIEKMIAAQRHRAPDGSGIYRDKLVELGMGRLSIIDLNSPGLALYEEDHFVLCYNGEIYNHIELRKELMRLGWVFRTSSDTEVLMEAYRQWGAQALDRFNGMFAFAIYDKRKKKLFLARDIAGEKPLYYFRRGKTFAFASEAKAFRGVVPLVERSDEFFDAFQHCHITTLWKDAYELPAAHYAEYSLISRKLRIVPWWQFSPRPIRLKTASDELEAILTDAVLVRTRSDVPYGLYYSKGLDSSLIAHLFDFKKKFYFDDMKDWKDDFYRQIPVVVKHLDFPVGSLSSYPLWKLAERATRSVKVVLSGEGADEIFGGYVRYLPISQQWELRNRFPSYQPLFQKYFPSYLDAFTRITARSQHLDFVRERLRPYFDMFPDPINAMGFADFKLVMPSLLQMGDRMAGAHGIENRCPFLDRRVIEFGFSLPPEYKISGLEQKAILRRILEKRGLIAPLRNEKKGLTIRFNSWLGAKDWDRSVYFSLLKEHWAAEYGNA